MVHKMTQILHSSVEIGSNFVACKTKGNNNRAAYAAKVDDFGLM